MERLTRILSMLAAADATTMAADDLPLAEIPYEGTNVMNQRDQGLRRDISHLESLGWQITNVAGEGEMSRYRLTAVDNRLRVEFTPAQRARAPSSSQRGLAGGAGRRARGAETTAADGDLQVLAEREGTGLSLVQRGVAGHCLLRFAYHDKPRVVHPHALHARAGG